MNLYLSWLFDTIGRIQGYIFSTWYLTFDEGCKASGAILGFNCFPTFFHSGSVDTAVFLTGFSNCFTCKKGDFSFSNGFISKFAGDPDLDLDKRDGLQSSRLGSSEFELSLPPLQFSLPFSDSASFIVWLNK